MSPTEQHTRKKTSNQPTNRVEYKAFTLLFFVEPTKQPINQLG